MSYIVLLLLYLLRTAFCFTLKDYNWFIGLLVAQIGKKLSDFGMFCPTVWGMPLDMLLIIYYIFCYKKQKQTKQKQLSPFQ